MIIAVCIIGILALIILSPVKIMTAYKNGRLIVKGGVGVLLFTFFDSSKKKPPQKEKKQKTVQKSEEKKEEDGKQEKNKLSLDSIKQIFETVYDALKFLKKHLTFFNLRFVLEFGTGDAAQTGILTGTAWAIFYNIAGLADRVFVLKNHEIDVKPHFDDELFDFDFECVAGLRLFWIFPLVISLLKNLKKLR